MSDIDPHLKYCTVCGDEYRKEIVNCAACGLELITGEEKLAQISGKTKPSINKPISANDELVAIQKGSLLDMKNLQAILKDKGVSSIISGDDGACGKGCCGPEVLLCVRAEERQDARTFLAGEFKRATSLASYDLSNVDAVFDENAQQVTCPACGHGFVPTSSECPDCGLAFA